MVAVPLARKLSAIFQHPARRRTCPICRSRATGTAVAAQAPPAMRCTTRSCTLLAARERRVRSAACGHMPRVKRTDNAADAPRGYKKQGVPPVWVASISSLAACRTTKGHHHLTRTCCRARTCGTHRAHDARKTLCTCTTPLTLPLPVPRGRSSRLDVPNRRGGHLLRQGKGG